MPQPVDSVRSVFLEFLQEQADKAQKMLAMAGGKATVAKLPDGTFEFVQTSPVFDLRVVYTLAGDATGTLVASHGYHQDETADTSSTGRRGA